VLSAAFEDTDEMSLLARGMLDSLVSFQIRATSVASSMSFLLRVTSATPADAPARASILHLAGCFPQSESTLLCLEPPHRMLPCPGRCSLKPRSRSSIHCHVFIACERAVDP
jgi:hypothetical protein